MTTFILLIALIGVNAFFAASEMAFVSLNDNKMRFMADEGHVKAQKVIRVLESPTRFLSTIQIGVTLAGQLSSAFASISFSDSLAVYLSNQFNLDPKILVNVVTIIITLILSYMSLVFGELVPKRVAIKNPEGFAFAVVDIIATVAKISQPFVNLLSFSTNTILRLLGINPDEQASNVTEEEIRMMVDVGEEKGTIRESEREMINNIFEFDNKVASDVMTHRREIVGLSIDASFEDVKKILKDERYTRFPIYDDNIDNIVGLVHLKDLLKFYERNTKTTFNLQRVMRKPFFVPESKHLHELFFELQKTRTHMAVVIDEYGGTAGVVTIEDLIEEIVGDIDDEYDIEENPIKKIGENSYDVEGSFDLEELNEILDISLPIEEYDTLSGFLISILGRIPEDHETLDIEYSDYLFKILKVNDKRIDKVRIVPKPKTELIEEKN